MQQSGAGRHESEDATVPDGAFRHRRHDERIHASGAGGCGSVDGQDGGSRVSSKRAGEAEWSERRKGKTEQEDVQSGIIRRSSAHRHNGGGRFFDCSRIEIIVIDLKHKKRATTDEYR